MEVRNKIASFSLSLILLASFCVNHRSVTPEIDAACVVEKVVDADTIWVRSVWGFKENQSFKVRLAEIDALELNEAGGKEAKKFLEDLLSNQSQIYLDVDEKRPYDKYGRVIAILYLKLNSTHYLNVNYLLVGRNHARWVDYSNSWHPEDFRKVVEIEHSSLFLPPE